MKISIDIKLATCSIICFNVLFIQPAHIKAVEKNQPAKIVQAGMVFTPSESKRLIATAVAQMPIVKNALKHGKVIITKGTTNTYIAEQLLGEKIQPGALVYGRVTPEKVKDPLRGTTPIPEVILVKGKHQKDMTLTEAMQQLKAGDVVIKGANALDYKNKTAGVIIGAPDSGTTGKIMPYIIARKAHLIIPVGLEKQISTDVLDLQLKMREPVESLNNKVPSMFLLTGTIITELEAMKILANVQTFQAAAGGIAGAQGSSWIIVRGKPEQVQKAMKIAEKIYGEPPFTK